MKGKGIRMKSKEYEQRLEALEREIAALRQETVEDEPTPPHQRPKPERGEIYYYIKNHGGITFSTWCDTEFDLGRRAIGDVFRNKEAAEYAAEYYKVLAQMREWAGKWNDPWIIMYDSFTVEAIPVYGKDVTFGELRFASEKDADNCIKAVGEDRLIKHYFGVRDHEADAETE